MICVGLYRYVRTKDRATFNWFLHGVLPLISLGAMVWVLYGNIHPYPPAPFRYFIYATIVVILISIAIVQWMSRRYPDAMARAGELMGDVEIEEERAREGL
jgi:hypothetical protein